MSDPDNAGIIAAVQRWQTHPFFHPLTCGVDSGHRCLEPVEVDGQVILVCSDCDYRQTQIPDVVVKFVEPKPVAIESSILAFERMA
jgi:hypothetical protein